MKTMWILVADSSHAKLYESDLHLEQITEIRDLVHEQSRMHERDITTDLPGSNAANGAGSHHRYEPHTGIKEQQLISFAREIDTLLDEGRRKGAFAKLAVVAAPDFLGHLRTHMNPLVRKLVAHESDKNIVKQGLPELRKTLPKTFFSRIE